MRTSKNGTALGWIPSWIVGKGNGPQVAVGVLLTGVLAVTLCAGGAWTVYTQGRAVREGEQRALLAGAGVLAHSAEELLKSGDATGLRRVLSDASIDNGLESASITLAGVGVIASRSLSDVTVQQVPDVWGRTANMPGSPVCELRDGEAVVTFPVRVGDRGDATVRVSKHVTAPMLGDVRAQVGLGVLAFGAAALTLLGYRVIRSRMRGLGAICEALHQASAFEPGELPASAMRISDELGEEALMWNQLLEERDRLVARRDIDAAAQKLQGPGGGGGDYASAFDALWMGLIVLDADGHIRAVNGAAAVFLKHQRQEMMSRSLSAYVLDAGVIEAVAGIVKGKNRQRAIVETTLEADAPGAVGTVLRFTVRPMRREDAAAALVVIEDITQQRVADESRNAFVAQATHELRTPLTNFRLYLEQLVDEGDKDPLVKARCINVLNTESRRLERTVTDMLSVSEIEAGTFRLHPDDVRLETLFSELREDFSAQATDKEIEFTVELPPKLPLMRGDRDKVSMALHNLVGNALKYTPTGGKVCVRVGEDNGVLRVDVADNGIGISEDEQELVFEKFYRSKDKRIGSITGSGIGLALARQVVRLHGGDIRVQSAVDKGSTFTMTVPLGQTGAKMAA